MPFRKSLHIVLHVVELIGVLLIIVYNKLSLVNEWMDIPVSLAADEDRVSRAKMSENMPTNKCLER